MTRLERSGFLKKEARHSQNTGSPRRWRAKQTHLDLVTSSSSMPVILPNIKAPADVRFSLAPVTPQTKNPSCASYCRSLKVLFITKPHQFRAEARRHPCHHRGSHALTQARLPRARHTDRHGLISTCSIRQPPRQWRILEQRLEKRPPPPALLR